MALQSNLFKSDPRLARCLVADSSHITLNQSGNFVSKIQHFLIVINKSSIATIEIEAMRYGKTTADSVLKYKTSRNIINVSYQAHPDNIVGKMTIAAMDQEMAAFEKTDPPSPIPANRFARFVPEPPKAPSGIRFGVTARVVIQPLGPFVEANGFDPDPRQDKHKAAPNETFQMVPSGETRVLLLSDPGLPGRPTYRFNLKGADGQASVADFVSFEAKVPSKIWELTIKGLGQKPGDALLEAVNISSGKVEATLRIAVLVKRKFNIGFVNVQDPSDKTGVAGLPDQWTKTANDIWLSQANVELQSIGSATHVFQESQSNSLTALRIHAPDNLAICQKLVPNADRYVMFIKEFEGKDGAIAGFAREVLYLSKAKATVDNIIFSHEFGHSVGLSHFDPPTFLNFNLMASFTDTTLLQGVLNMSQILSSNLTPGTFRDVD